MRALSDLHPTDYELRLGILSRPTFSASSNAGNADRTRRGEFPTASPRTCCWKALQRHRLCQPGPQITLDMTQLLADILR